MQDDVRAESTDRGGEPVEVTDVGNRRIPRFVDTSQLVQAGLRRWCQRVTRDIGPEALQQQAKPGGLEAGVPGDENAASLPVAEVKLCWLSSAQLEGQDRKARASAKRGAVDP